MWSAWPCVSWVRLIDVKSSWWLEVEQCFCLNNLEKSFTAWDVHENPSPKQKSMGCKDFFRWYLIHDQAAGVIVHQISEVAFVYLFAFCLSVALCMTIRKGNGRASKTELLFVGAWWLFVKSQSILNLEILLTYHHAGQSSTSHTFVTPCDCIYFKSAQLRLSEQLIIQVLEIWLYYGVHLCFTLVP